MRVTLALPLALLLPLMLAGCSLSALLMPDAGEQPQAEVDDRFPDVLTVRLVPAGERTYDVRVTISSPYDTPQRYADGWRVLAPDGTVLGTHTLMHDHASEQPFTRTQRALHIPAGVDTVTVEGRDQANGFGGATITLEVPE